MRKFLIRGGNPLKGEIRISGSKNAALPILAATLLTKDQCVLKNVPDIVDVHSILHLLRKLGAEAEFKDGTVIIKNEKIKRTDLPKKLVKCIRASILFLGPMLARSHKVRMFFPGGCLIGRRSIRAHLYALRDLGAKLVNTVDYIELKAEELKGKNFAMWEPSVTATENAIMAAVLAKGETILRLAATEPHIQDLCHFLNKCGAEITGIGTPILTIQGQKKLHGTEHEITSDYIEAGTFAIAAAVTPKSEVTLTHVKWEHLDSFWNKLKETGVKVNFGKDKVTIRNVKNIKPIPKLDTRLYPYFPTDLQSPFAILLTQAEGVSKIFETMFEGRLNYLFEIEKMGARVEILNPHQAIIIGPTELKGSPVTSCDLRAGAAVVLAGLIAKGETEISNINYIERGYENLDGKLRKIGADIRKVQK